MTDIIGHLIGKNMPAGIGSHGLFYDYIMTGGGIMLEAKNQNLWARIPIAEGTVRGLSEMPPFFVLKHCRIPRHLFDIAFSVVMARRDLEVYLAITLEGKNYEIVFPVQEGGSGKVEYRNPENVILDLHSHMGGPGFSDQDDQDETGFKLYGCIGDLWEPRAAVNFRVGVYGYFWPVRFEDIFDGPPAGIDDVVALERTPAGKDERHGMDD